MAYHVWNIICRMVSIAKMRKNEQNNNNKNICQDESQRGYLHCIPEDHIDMLKLYERVEGIVGANQTGPTTYLYPIYTYYYPLIADRIKKMTEAIFEQETIPPLPVCICQYFLHSSMLLIPMIQYSRIDFYRFNGQIECCH